MPQRPKAEVRQSLLDAATDEILERGFARATMSAIARRAGTAVGNLYRYFPTKQALFEAVLPASFVAEFEQLLARRLASLAALERVDHLGADARNRQGALLDHWIRHRRQVVILLDRCEGTAHAGFGQHFVDDLVRFTAEALEARSGAPLPVPTRLVLEQVFDGTRRTLVGLLAQERPEPELRAAFATFWRFQLAGLATLQTTPACLVSAPHTEPGAPDDR